LTGSPAASLLIAQRARAASRVLGRATTAGKNAALEAIARCLLDRQATILAANARDLERADAAGITPALRDRLRLDVDRLAGVAGAVRQLAELPDPVGVLEQTERRPNGLSVSRMRIPLGVILVIYEARPNVTADAAALCLKSGNAVILRGGSDAFESSLAIAAAIQQGLESAGLPQDAVQVVPTTDRAAMLELLALDELVDLAIPRGGESLIRFVAEHARVPVIRHYKGVCHVYVDEGADLPAAIEICYNAKVQRPGVCNALETLLVHRSIAREFLPALAARTAEAGVELRGDPETRTILPAASVATEEDFHAEYLALILAIRVVDSLDQAMEHIERYGSHHTEAIVTRDRTRAERFLREVDSSCVLWNASTRFNDGGELGLGAEIGISTTKIHAFGPMGLESLTTRKFVVVGDGHTRRV
jgi:glutamate-5-semialdehyde dehydrogenase